MATVFVRDLDDAVYERLKARAAGNNRSLEVEVREILVLASKKVDVAMARAAAEAMRTRLEGRSHMPTAGCITVSTAVRLTISWYW
jgi:antitoxin FitA